MSASSTEVTAVSLAVLQGELDDLGTHFRSFSDNDLFVLWFLHAYLADDEDIAAKALVGVANDKSVDAVLIDDRARVVFLVQAKFRQRVGEKAEGRSDVTAFADLGSLLWGEREAYRNFTEGLDPLVSAKLDEARDRLQRRDRYRLHLYYVTMGRCSKPLRLEAEGIVRQAQGATEFDLLEGRDVLGVLRDYLDGVAPPVRSLDLPVQASGKVQYTGVVSRFDPASQIESWVFTMSGRDVAHLFETTGTRLFARNIRGFLGGTRINQAMEATLSDRPQYFWYFNNGVTIVCDGAQQIRQKGKEVLRLNNPQVINGQQTTRVLAAQAQLAPEASVLARVIQIPRGSDAGDRFDELVSRIVEATNWQNQIKASDLVANDRRQVLLERELRKLGYQYLRKRQTKREARRAAGSRFRLLIKKEELAQAVAACKLDPLIVREGKEGLFEEQYYTTIFDSTSPSYYLDRYWLMRRVSAAARGYPEWAYAKWVVLHFLWKAIGRDIDSHSVRFRTACERPRQNDRLLAALNSVIRSVFFESLAFYRENRGGRGPRAMDVSTFFKRKNLHKEFATFWDQSANLRRKRSFESAVQKLRRELNSQ